MERASANLCELINFRERSKFQGLDIWFIVGVKSWRDDNRVKEKEGSRISQIIN